jgi:MSHA biogenesis protein MshI
VRRNAALRQERFVFGSSRKRKLQEGLTAVGLYADGACAARVIATPGQRPRLAGWRFEAIDSEHPAEKVLAGVARELDLKRARCSTVLNEGDYQLVLTEAPEVPAGELKAALRWRVKDLIDFHINDATLDVFDLPDARGGSAREMYVVAARTRAVRERIERLEAAGANLEIIDIPELAQRNIAVLLPQDAQGVAFLWLHAGGGSLTLTRQGMLYLTRPLTIGTDMLANAERRHAYFDQIVLEVQRSLDYYESHFRAAPIRHLVLAPLATKVPGLVEHLGGSLNVQVGSANLATLIDCEVEVPAPWQARCLATIGAALREATGTP